MNSHYSHQSTNQNWIGDTPSHWSIRRLKYLTKVRKDLSVNGTEELLSVTETKGIVKRKELRNTEENISRSENLSGYRLVRKGDLVNNIMLVWKRGLGVSQYEGIVSPAYSVFSFNNECDPNFFNYLLRSDEYISEFRRHSTGITMSRLRLYDDSFGNVFAHLPPIEEQKLISRYLDKKTDQIDSLIEKIQKKIELLKEQRTSLINQCVTKGLDPKVEMKDSGVEWIGEIPSHWEMWSVRHLIGVEEIEVQDGNHGEIHPKSDDYVEEGIPFVMSSNLVDGGLDVESTKKLLKSQTDNLRIGFSYRGDVLLSHKGSIGKVGIVGNIDTEYVMLTPQVTYYRTRQQILLRDFLYLSFQSVGFLTQMLILSSDGSTRNFCGIVDQKNLFLPIPPIEEQKTISQILQKKVDELDLLVVKEEDRINLLKEYRQSLISSVVIGKIRVTEDLI